MPTNKVCSKHCSAVPNNPPGGAVAIGTVTVMTCRDLVLTTGVFLFQEGSPFIVCMTYAFQTPEKLCFILDLMNGGDLHYHLSQHGVFHEKEVRFYAAEVILGLEHMHNRFVVYRDLKVRGPHDFFMEYL